MDVGIRFLVEVDVDPGIAVCREHPVAPVRIEHGFEDGDFEHPQHLLCFLLVRHHVVRPGL